MPVIRVFVNFIHKFKIRSLQNRKYVLKLYGRVIFTIKSYFAGRGITKKLFPKKEFRPHDADKCVQRSYLNLPCYFVFTLYNAKNGLSRVF